MKFNTTLLLATALTCLTIIACEKAEIKREILWTSAWSPDGMYIAVGGNQGDLKLFDGESYELITTYPVKEVILSRLKWHPTKRLLAVVTQSPDSIARILNVDTGQWTKLEGLESSARAVDWSPSGGLLAISELEGAVSIFTLEGIRVSRFMADPKMVTDLDWHPRDDLIVTVGSQIGLYTSRGDTITTFKSREDEPMLLCVEWHNSGDFFVTGDYGELNTQKVENVMLQYWKADSTNILNITDGKMEYRNIRWNSTGTILASASEALRLWSPDGTLIAQSQATDDLLWGVDWSPDGNNIVTSSMNGNIVIWDKEAIKIQKLKY